MANGLYVETLIRGALDEVWRLTQTPDLHERWDLRFTSIDYLPRPDDTQPQRFLYATRIGFGLKIQGQGESVGNTSGPDGQRASVLKFWSNDRKSLIRSGSGYWKYTPTSDGVRFVTGYDYEVRFGALGRLFDWLVFRPLLGWATAWSFDRLRLWIEKGIDPALSLQRSLTYALARLSLAFVWIYHGLIPKLLFQHSDELAMLRDAGTPPEWVGVVLFAVGAVELIFGLAMVFTWRQQWPLWLTIALMALALLGVMVNSPEFLVAAFNPVSLNVLVIVLAGIGLLSSADQPSAANCRRHPSIRVP